MKDIMPYLERITQSDMGPEYSALLQKVIGLEKPIMEIFSLNYMDKLSEAQGDVLRFERQECFSRGFRLGVQLTLAGLQPFSA